MKLTDEEIITAINAIPGWLLKGGKLRRELSFGNFQEAFAFMTEAAIISERLNHHPEWSNVYNRVIIELTTHDYGGISARDITWAKEANKTLKKYSL